MNKSIWLVLAAVVATSPVLANDVPAPDKSDYML